MAKGLRASSRRKNNQALRQKVFGPVVDARTERLSAKLQELAAKPRSDKERTGHQEIDRQDRHQPTDHASDEMDLDTQEVKMKRAKRQNMRTGVLGEREKRIAKRKSKNSIVFAHLRAKRARITKSKRK